MKGINLEDLKKIFKDSEKLYSSRELFSIFGYEYSSSKGSRDSVFKILKSMIDLEQIGRKYKVTEIYEEFKEIEDNRKGNSGKAEGSRANNTGGIYVKYLNPILIHIFNDLYTKNKGEEFYMTNNTMAKQCGFINSGYLKSFDNKNICKSYLKRKGITNTIAMYDFFNKSKDSYKGAIKYAIDNLSKEYGFEYEYTYLTIIKESEKETHMYKTDEEDIEKVQKIESDVLKEMGQSKIGYVLLNDTLRKKYYNKVDLKVKKEIGGNISIIKGYAIKLNKKFDNIIDKTGMNNKVKELFEKNIYKNLKKNCDKIVNNCDNMLGIPKNKGEKAKLEPSYLEDCKIVIHNVLGKDINYDIERMIRETNKQSKDNIEFIKESGLWTPKEIKGFKVPY